MPEITDERIAEIKADRSEYPWRTTIDIDEVFSIISRLERAEAALKESEHDKNYAERETNIRVRQSEDLLASNVQLRKDYEALEAERDAMKEKMRYAWQSGFELARHYGDNFVHFRGEQKERHWQRLLEDIAAKSAGYK